MIIVPLASPVKLAPCPELSTTVTASVLGLKVGSQAAMVPSAVAKMKAAGRPGPGPVPGMRKTVPSAAGLICPVGEVVTLGALPFGPGMATTRALGTPAVLYRVLTLAPESEAQNGPAGPSEIPVGRIRLGSVLAATPATLATRLTCRKSLPVTAAAADSNLRSSRHSRV